MHQPLIIQHLFQVSSLEDVSRERLEAFVEAYPSYGIGHYLLTCKLQAEGSERFMPETQRTCLYFSNPLWLQWLLQNSDGLAAEPPAETSVAEEPRVEEATHAPVIEEPNAEGTVENVVTMAEEAFVSPESLSTGEVEHITAGEGENLMAASSGEPSAAEQLLRSIEEAKELRESLQRLNTEADAGTVIAGESLPAEPEPLETATTPESHEESVTLEEPATYEAAALHEEPVAEEPAAPHEEPIQDEETPFVLDEPAEQPAVVAEAQPEAVIAETPAAPEAQTAPEPQPAAEELKAAPTVTQDFLFEPYHTIDYFASQGIKLTLDENPQDKLGKQLRSFTEWLKTMRRLPQKDREVVPDRVMEEAIQTSAAHSIQGKDVLTETMAEVLAKQGMREKARAVYEKLSLLNPDKRAYFAAKIEQLNIP